MTKCFMTDLNNYADVDLNYYDFEISDRESAEVLFIGLDVIDDDYLRKFVSLQLIASRTTNRDHIVSSKIPVVFLEKDDVIDVSSTAEFTMMLILMLMKRIKAVSTYSRPIGLDLNKRTITIVGYGRIGKMVSKFAAAFGMNVLVCTRYTNIDVMKQMFGSSDVVSIHLPAKKEFTHFMDKEKIGWMKDSSFIVNTARPYMIDKTAILRALRDGRIGGVAMDYLGFETDEPDNDLLNYAKAYNNLIVTPHLGGNSRDAIRIVAERLVKKVRDMI